MRNSSLIMDLVGQYLTLYQNLSNPQKSSDANKQLMKLEASQQSWLLVKQLLSQSNTDDAFMHGCQLLSKKLNRPYQLQLQKSLNLIGLIYSQKTLNQTLFYCLAKLHLHLDLQEIKIDAPHDSPLTLISILKLIPEASKIITVVPLAKQDQKSSNGQYSSNQTRHNREYYRSKNYLERYKQLLIQYSTVYPDEIIKCIDNFVANNFKINDADIIRLLITRQLSQISSILESILLCEKYPQLNSEIYNYLLKNGLQDITSISDLQDFCSVYLAFCSNLNLLELNHDLLLQIFTKIIEFMRLQLTPNSQCDLNSDYSIIQSSFTFISQVANILINTPFDQSKQVQVQLCYKFLVEVWKIIVQKCHLSQLPEFKQQKSDPLVISLDDDDDQQPINISIKVTTSKKFRNVGEDFIILIFNCISLQENFRKQALELINQLATGGNPLHLQLSIFVISCIVENAKSCAVESIGQIIQFIVSHQHAKIPYIWQQLIKLMSKFGTETTSNLKILQLTLLVLKQSLQIVQLRSLASQTFNNIVSSCQQSSEKHEITKYFQQFINAIYESLYLELLFPKLNNNEDALQAKINTSTFESLTKSIFIFIYSFKKDQNYFIQYLQSIAIRISKNQMTTQNKQRVIQILSDLALGHSFINENESKMFTAIFSEFQAQYAKLICEQINNCLNQYSHYRQKHKTLINQFGLILGAVSGFSSNIWSRFILQLLKSQVQLGYSDNQLPEKYKNEIKKSTYKYVSLAVIFLKMQNHQGQNYHTNISAFVSNSFAIIEILLTNSKNKDYQLISQCLAYNFQIMKRHATYVTNYNPDTVFLFIKQRIMENYQFWEYAIFRTSLGILRMFIQKHYQIQLILELVITCYSRLIDCFWKSLEAILYEAYKQGGMQVYESVFSRKCQKLMPPNPLFEAFRTALINNDSKTIKNLLECIK